MDTNYSFGIERDEEALKRNNLDHRKWTNPLEVQCVVSVCFGKFRVEIDFIVSS